MDPVDFCRARKSCKFLNEVAIGCRQHIRVPVKLKDLVIGPVPLPVTVSSFCFLFFYFILFFIKQEHFKKKEAKQQKRGEVRFYAVYVFPHDNEYFDIKPDGTCSSHLHWTTQREMVPYDAIEESLAGYQFKHAEIVSLSVSCFLPSAIKGNILREHPFYELGTGYKF